MGIRPGVGWLPVSQRLIGPALARNNGGSPLADSQTDRPGLRKVVHASVWGPLQLQGLHKSHRAAELSSDQEYSAFPQHTAIAQHIQEGFQGMRAEIDKPAARGRSLEEGSGWPSRIQRHGFVSVSGDMCSSCRSLSAVLGGLAMHMYAVRRHPTAISHPFNAKY